MSTATPSEKAVRVFYSYSHEDQYYREQLENHLSLLKHRYDLQTWFDRQIHAGEHWETVLDEHLNTADLILLLISPNFIASNYCYKKEMQYALARHAKGEVRVIPILVRYVYWKNAPFSHLQILPTGAKPIKSWSDTDEAFYDIVVEIEKVIEDLLTERETKKRRIEEDVSFKTTQYKQVFASDPTMAYPDSERSIIHDPQTLSFDPLRQPGEARPDKSLVRAIRQQERSMLFWITIISTPLLVGSGLLATFLISTGTLWLQFIGILLLLIVIRLVFPIMSSLQWFDDEIFTIPAILAIGGGLSATFLISAETLWLRIIGILLGLVAFLHIIRLSLRAIRRARM